MSYTSGRKMVALAATLLCLALPVAVWAQQGAPNTAAFEKELGITPAQKAKIEAIQKKHKPEIEALQKKFKPKAETLQKQMQALQQQMQALQQQYITQVRPIAQKVDKEVQDVLTPAQREKIKKMNAAAAAQQGGGQPGGMPPQK